ncbi:MAG: hypothetical protein ABJD11_13815 [Gemmatimonadota bacterium]
MTIVSESAALGELLTAVRLAAPEAVIEIEGQAVTPGDRFSKLMLGMHNHFRNDAREAGAAGTALLKRVLAVQLAGGVVAEPSLRQEAWMQRAVAAATQSLDGMLFDGRVLRASDGTALLGPGMDSRGLSKPGS